MNRMLRKIALLLLATVLFTGLLAACSSSTTPTPSSFTITDSNGRVVTIKNNHPQKIVSLAPSNTEILYALGLADRIAAVTDYADYPPEATAKPSVGAYDNPNLEAIVAMEPDLILATDGQPQATLDQLESRGLTVVVIIPHSIDEVLTMITLIGKVTGQDEEAATLVADMQKRIDAVTEKTKNLTTAEKPRVFYIIWQDPIWTTGSGTFEDALIELAGGVNIAHELTGYATISLETVIAANPQVMVAGVGMGTGEDAALQFLQTESRLVSSDARRNNRVTGINMDVVARPGPRIVSALEEFFKIIHPELQ